MYWLCYNVSIHGYNIFELESLCIFIILFYSPFSASIFLIVSFYHPPSKFTKKNDVYLCETDLFGIAQWQTFSSIFLKIALFFFMDR